MLDKEEYKLHREKIAQNMAEKSVLILFAGKKPEFKCAPNKNFYYATGIEESDDICFIIKDKALKSQLLISEYDEFKAKWVGRGLNKEEAFEISGIEEIDYLNSFNRRLDYFIETGYIIYFDFIEQDINDLNESYEHALAKKLKGKYPYAKIENGRGFLRAARTIKTPNEIEEIKKAIHATNEGIKALMRNAKPGLYEYQLESYFDKEIKFNGADGYSFDTIAAAGKNSCCLHYSANKDVLKDGDLILFDLGSTNKHYCADISRTFPVNGRFTSRQREVYNIVLNGQKLMFDTIKPGYTTKQLNEILIKYYCKELKRIGLITNDIEVSKYYFHGVSHHLGLDCHDLCDYTPLKAGSVISNEPGLYIPEWNIGIRIEDDVLVTEDGCINLSEEIIKSVEDIEKYMSR